MIQNQNEDTHFNQVAHAQGSVANLHSGFDIVHWKVDKNSVCYHREDFHTLSLYLCGGETSYRADKTSLKGAPGKFCLMPQNQDSHWHVNGEIEFVHLYFSDKLLKHFASTVFDTDVRFIELKDLVYETDPQLKTLLERFCVLNAVRPRTSVLELEQCVHLLLHHLLANHNGFQMNCTPVRGGLSPSHRRLVVELIESCIGDKLSIELLANEVDLSPYHFARMFKMSFGESPANFINQRRVERAKRGLTHTQSLAQISLDCGFSHQSHMTASFKKIMGLTPAVYRQKLGQVITD